MLINKIDIKNYNGKLLNKDIQNAELTNDVRFLDNAFIPIYLNSKYKYRIVNLEILISANSLEENLICTGKIINELINADVEFNNINGTHKLFLQKHKRIKTLKQNKCILNLELIGYFYKDIITEELNKITKKTINYKGSLETNCIIEINPTIAIGKIEIEGLTKGNIVIKNLTEGKKIIINGEKQIVTEEGINKFKDVELWEFPKLKPGNNYITVTSNTCYIKIIYKTLFI